MGLYYLPVVTGKLYYVKGTLYGNGERRYFEYNSLPLGFLSEYFVFCSTCDIGTIPLRTVRHLGPCRTRVVVLCLKSCKTSHHVP